MTVISYLIDTTKDSEFHSIVKNMSYQRFELSNGINYEMEFNSVEDANAFKKLIEIKIPNLYI